MEENKQTVNLQVEGTNQSETIVVDQNTMDKIKEMLNETKKNDQTQKINEQTIIPEEPKEKHLEKMFSLSFGTLHEKYKSGKIKKLNKDEMELLEFCHDRDMKEFLKEEFKKNPTPKFTEDGGCPYPL